MKLGQLRERFDVFISYSRKDIDAVKTIKNELERNGFPCWIDIDGIESGDENFKRKIVPALDVCKVALFFISVDSQRSEWTDKELGYAKRHGKHVVPLRFNDDTLVGEFDIEYGNANIIDWRRSEQRNKLSDLFILCWSANASKSEYVRRELSQALNLAYPKIQPREKARLTIRPISIDPRADPPDEMKDIYNFEEF